MKEILVFQQPKTVAEIDLGSRFQQSAFFFWQSLASETADAGGHVVKHEARSTRRA